MTNISEISQFDTNVQRYDLLDPVLGNDSGESNIPIKQLANRTRFLYDYVNGHAGVSVVSASANIDVTYLRKLVYVDTANNITLTLAAASSFLNGQKLSFAVKTTGVKSVRIALSGDTIVNLPVPFTALWLMNGERIDLVKVGAASWWLVDIDTNLNMVGNDAMVRRLPKNAAVANGSITTVSRADYARLWDLVNAAGLAVNEAAWLSDAVIYRTLFSSGNGTTTMRFPDMRSISWRALDLSRGLSFSRTGSVAGSYEADRVGPHTHPIEYEPNGSDGTPNAQMLQHTGAENGGSSGINTEACLANTGNIETTVKTAGLIPVIYY
jgi:hypothetical protein